MPSNDVVAQLKAVQISVRFLFIQSTMQMIEGKCGTLLTDDIALNILKNIIGTEFSIYIINMCIFVHFL